MLYIQLKDQIKQEIYLRLTLAMCFMAFKSNKLITAIIMTAPNEDDGIY